MDRKTTCREGCNGVLPASAPLANPFVPFQQENPPRYEPEKAFIRGTAYPGLDLPFMGLVNTREKNMTPMTQLQILGFMIQELALYLDTHREDQDALELYRSYQNAHHEAMVRYTRECGPLNHMSPGTGPYKWLNDPWPWEYANNREG